MTIQFKDGDPRVAEGGVSGLFRDLDERLSTRELEERLGAVTFRQFRNGHMDFADEEVWPLLRVAYERDVFSRIPANGLPSVSYNLYSDVQLEAPPLGAGLELPEVELAIKQTKIADLVVDFPLGLPASMIAANASYLKHYARLGFPILTYKTVRSGNHPHHRHPQWVFLEDASEQLPLEELRAAVLKDGAKYAEDIRAFKGRQKFFPNNRVRSSMANSFGVPSYDPRWWMADVASAREFIHRGHQILIVSVMATVPEEQGSLTKIKKDFVTTAEMARDAGADIIELNLSCRNTKERAGEICYHPEDSGEIVAAVKKAVKLPIFAKIGYMPYEMLRAFLAATSSNIDGVVGINTVSARIYDAAVSGQARPIFPGRATAGVSGWAIQRAAHEVSENLVRLRDEMGRRDNLWLLGIGGVMTQDDFKKRLDSGVDAVEICTAAFFDPLIGFKIRRATNKDYGTIRGGTSKVSTTAGAGQGAPAGGAMAGSPKGEETSIMAPEEAKDIPETERNEDPETERFVRRATEVLQRTRGGWRGFGRADAKAFSDPERARKILVDAGILDDSGNVRKRRSKSPR